ncbi:hypothetical protein EMIT0P265_100040 [Pseudomonas zeae]
MQVAVFWKVPKALKLLTLLFSPSKENALRGRAFGRHTLAITYRWRYSLLANNPGEQ